MYRVLLVEDEEIELETLNWRHCGIILTGKRTGFPEYLPRAMAEGHWSAWKKIWQIL